MKWQDGFKEHAVCRLRKPHNMALVSGHLDVRLACHAKIYSIDGPKRGEEKTNMDDDSVGCRCVDDLVQIEL